MISRIGLFLLTNFAILIVLNTTLTALGFEHWMVQNGIDFNVQGVLVLSLAIGMGGAFVSLALSKTLAKRGMRVKLIDQPQNSQEQWLVETIAQQAKTANIRCPEIGIFPMEQPNAFATGMFRNKALVAVSVGLLKQMNQDQVEAVLGHEISHVANGDMITLALIQGVINTFVIFLSRAVGHIVDRAIFKSRGYGPGYFITVIVTQIILSILATTIVMRFSRHREFRADRGGAYLAGRNKMISALKRLQAVQNPQSLPDTMAAFGISGKMSSGIKRLFTSHPPLAARIQALEQLPDKR